MLTAERNVLLSVCKDEGTKAAMAYLVHRTPSELLSV